MVGLVIVSHSRALAEALVRLMQPLAAPDMPVAVAAGVGPDRSEFGTDALEISQAIQRVYSPDGVLVLMDLGSAVLSAELALELLPPGMASAVRFCPAPLVEGALAAIVQIGLNSNLDAVYQEAQQSLFPKASHLESHVPAPTQPKKRTTAELGQADRQVVLTLHNQHGLHARPAARFVQTAGRFQARIRVTNLTNNKGPVRATSLNELTTLGAIRDHQIQIEAWGADAEQAVAALQSLVESNFGEAVEQPSSSIETPIRPALPNTLSGAPVSPGVAMGPFFPYRPALPPIPTGPAADPQQAWESLLRAVEATRQSLDQRRRQLTGTLGEAQAAIFDAHLLILQDPAVLERTQQAILSGGENAAAAWYAAIQEIAATYRQLEDPYLQQRAADVMDVGNQVLFALSGRPAVTTIELPGPVILFAEDLTPTETAQLDLSKVLGIITTAGGGTSHSAILARALGVPAVSGVGPAFNQLQPGTLVALDGSSGAVWIKPSSKVQSQLSARQKEWQARRAALLKESHALTQTKDGKRVEVFANIGSAKDAQTAVQNGAEGVGLLRTEFLFLARQTPPGEDEQMTVLNQIGAAMGSRPVTVRTLDVGGDKEVPYIHLPREANPFLGVRALRMSLQQPDLFMTQLRAILRAGHGHNFRIMFPMVATVDEIWQAREFMEKAHQELVAEKLQHAWPIETGIMIEIPSAALLGPVLAAEVDFFSIGTNDLTQYTLAAERGSRLLSGLADAMHPAVLRLIGESALAVHQHGKWVGVCGELAGDPLAAAILVGLGVDELSLNSAGIPQIKDILRRLDTKAAQDLAAKALRAQNAAQVRQLASDFMNSLG